MCTREEWWGCPVENTGCVTTMFRGTSYCYVNNLAFGTYGTSSCWGIMFSVDIILYRLNIYFQMDFSLCSLSCANLSLLFFSTAFSSLSWANFGSKKVYAELANISCSNEIFEILSEACSSFTNWSKGMYENYFQEKYPWKSQEETVTSLLGHSHSFPAGSPVLGVSIVPGSSSQWLSSKW